MSKCKPMRVTVTVEPAEVEWSDILDCITVEADDIGHGAPWKECDGWEHDADKVGHCNEHEDRERSIRYVSRTSREGGDVWLTLDVAKSGIPDWTSYHAAGASKQVSRELAARALREAYATLHGWYANGWEWWQVSGELHDCSVSLCGIDDYDYATDTVTEEIADELASELTAAGYVVINRPDLVAPVKHRPYAHHGVNWFNVSKR